MPRSGRSGGRHSTYLQVPWPPAPSPLPRPRRARHQQDLLPCGNSCRSTPETRILMTQSDDHNPEPGLRQLWLLTHAPSGFRVPFPPASSYAESSAVNRGIV